MADLGNLYFDILLRDMTDKDIDRIKKKLEKIGVKIDADVNRKTLEKNIREALKNKTFKVNLEAGKNIKKAAIEANKNILTNSVSNALKGKVFTADLKLAVKSATVQDAIKQAFAKAGLQYNTTASDVRAQRIAEIQQRMAIRAANAQRNLGNSYRYAANGAYESARASVVLGRSFHTNIRLAGELGTAMGNFASVFGIKDALENLVQIGGQLENQRIALGAILQDGGKATEMFGKIQSLAVKSPFGIMDLNQYTKQLSAYGIEYNELYDTMKRMADISAGVGVDMGRIILAFGQVKAAGFLKGTELRQFTEANIPMVDKLAERFSNLEKRIVSAAEVYDMISKKKVTFEDVKSVLWDLTGEGGMFNNMQEVLSESLASKWKNLADAIDVMYGKIADGAIGGGLKNLAVFLTELTKNWEYLATAIGSASAAFIAYKASVAIGSGKGAYGVYNMIAANHQLEASNLRVARSYRTLSASEQGVLATKERYTSAELRQAAAAGVLTKEMTLRLVAMGKISVAQVGHLKQVLGITRAEIAAAAATSKWKVALAVFGNTLNGVWLTMKAMLLSPWTWAFAGITAITELFTYYGKKQDEIEERNKNFAESAKGSAETLERELLKIKDLDVSKMNTDEMKIKVKELTTVIQNEADGWQSILSEIFAKEADGTFKNSVEEQLKLLKTKMDELAEAKKKLMGDNESYSDVIGSTETGWAFWEKDVVDRARAYSEAVEKNNKGLKDLALYARDVSTALASVSTGNAVISNAFKDKSINEQVVILKDYTAEWDKFIKTISSTNPEAFDIIDTWFSNIEGGFVGNKQNYMTEYFSIAKDKMIEELMLKGEEIGKLTETGRQYVLGFVDGLIKESAIQSPIIQQYIYDWFTNQFKLPRVDLGYLVPSTITGITSGGDTGGSKKDAIAEMWKKRAAEIEKAVKIYDKWKAIEGKLFAENRVKSSDEFANLFSGTYGFNLDLESPTDAYEYIQKLLDSSKDKQKELMVNLGVKISDAEYNDAKREFDKRLNELKEYAKDTVSKWELYKKLFDATGDKDFAKSAFDNTQVWDDAAREMKKNLEEEMDKQGSLVELDFTISDESAKEAFEGKSGLYELWKQIKDRIEKNGIDLKINTGNAIKEAKDFEMQVEEIERELHEKLELIGKSGLPSDVIGRLTQSLIENAERATATIEFDKFKKEIGYTQFFANLEHQGVDSILTMRDAMLKFGDSANLTHEEMAQIADDIERMMDVLVKNHPFKAINSAAAMKVTFREEYKIASENFKKNPSLSNANILASAKANLDMAEQMMIDSMSEIQAKFEELSNVVSGLSSMFEKFGNTGLKHFAEALESASSGMSTGTGAGKFIGGLFGQGGAGGIVGGFVGAATGAMAGLVDAGRKAVAAEQERSQIVIDRLDKVSSLLKEKIADSLTGLYNSTLDATSRMEMTLQKEKYDAAEKYYKDKGEDINPNTWYATTFDNTSFSWDTNEYLIYSKKTHEAINKALEADNKYMAMYASLLAQRDEMLYQQATYTDKDSEDVEAFKRDKQIEIEKITMEIEQLSKDMMSSLYSVDFQDWSSKLANSIVNAWATGEDAAKAYEGTVSDIMRNVATSLVRQQVIGEYLNKNLKPFIDEFIAKNGIMDEQMFSTLGDIVDGVGDRTDDALKFMDSLEKVINEKGLTLKDLSDSSEKGGLSKGIQSVTEDTANLLASYVNSMRADLSVNRTLIEQLVSVDVPQISIIAQAQLQQLQQVAANTRRNADAADRIYELVNKVVDKGGNKLRI